MQISRQLVLTWFLSIMGFNLVFMEWVWYVEYISYWSWWLTLVSTLAVAKVASYQDGGFNSVWFKFACIS